MSANGYKKMTDGERAVWAARFVQALDLSRPPRGIATPGREGDWREWEGTEVASACESAWCAVSHIRGAKARVLEGWGRDSETYLMLCDILGEKL